MTLQKLDENADLMLLMEFRQTYWTGWVQFTKERGYEAKVRP